jgi:hypothetical protein
MRGAGGSTHLKMTMTDAMKESLIGWYAARRNDSMIEVRFVDDMPRKDRNIGIGPATESDESLRHTRPRRTDDGLDGRSSTRPSRGSTPTTAGRRWSRWTR